MMGIAREMRSLQVLYSPCKVRIPTLTGSNWKSYVTIETILICGVLLSQCTRAPSNGGSNHSAYGLEIGTYCSHLPSCIGKQSPPELALISETYENWDLPRSIEYSLEMRKCCVIYLSEGKGDTEVVSAILQPSLNDNLNTRRQLWSWQELGLW